MYTALSLSLVLSAAAPTYDLFKDKGDTFIRAGTNKAIKVGTEVQVLGEPIGDTGEYRSAGSATVMEVWETIARVSLDEEAQKHPEAKKVRVGGKPAPAAATLPKAEESSATGPAGGTLKGAASVIGLGPAKQITVRNQGTVLWTNCDLRLPDNRHYKLAQLRGNDQERIFLHVFKQDGTELDRPLDSIVVKCDQGTSRFNFSL